MDQLSIYLPPFAGDYSGVCSALYDLNCVIIIDDASCCTRNYVSYDEPRWTIKKKTAFCSRLRTIDAVLGDDEKLILQTIEAVRQYDPDFVAILGTPVPAIIGKDMNGIAHEIQARSGYPTLGFDTTGFSYYNKGISSAFLKLIKRFVKAETETIANSVNILGLTPLDFSANNNNGSLVKLLEDNGLEVVCSFMMNTDLERVRRTAAAEVNLVVSQSGWAAAKYMQEQFGIPYVAATPMGRGYGHIVLDALRQTAKDKFSRVLSDAAYAINDAPELLIIGDQVISNSLRMALYCGGCQKKITVASFFAIEADLSIPGDLHLKNEKQLIDLLRSGLYKELVCDPLIAAIPAASGLKCHSLPHPAVSSLLYWDAVPLFVEDEFEAIIQSWIDLK